MGLAPTFRVSNASSFVYLVRCISNTRWGKRKRVRTFNRGRRRKAVYLLGPRDIDRDGTLVYKRGFPNSQTICLFDNRWVFA